MALNSSLKFTSSDAAAISSYDAHQYWISAARGEKTDEGRFIVLQVLKPLIDSLSYGESERECGRGGRAWESNVPSGV